MPWIFNSDGSTTLIHRYRKPGATGGTTKRRTIPTQIRAEVVRALAELVSECECSLTFRTCVEHAVSENGGAGMSSVYEIIKRELGKYPVDDRFIHRYQEFIDRLKAKNYSVNTISNYKSCIRHSLRRAWLNGIIKEIPIRDYGIKHKFRSRVLSSDERTRLYANMDPDYSLYWIVYLSERNPIRKMDVSRLTRENLVLVGESAPYIRFYAQKTDDDEGRGATILHDIDAALLGWFSRVSEEFPDCPYLFPSIHRNKRYGTSGWKYMGNWRKAFTTACRDAKIYDFHPHDLRHCAFTAMRQGGRSYEDIKALGLQATERAIRVYDQSDAMDVLRRIRQENCITSVSHIEAKNA